MIHSKRLLLILLALVILTFLVVACVGGSQIAGTPTPEAKVETEPTPTRELLKPESTESPSPTKTDVIDWDQGKDYIGTSISVCGPVVDTNTDRDSQGNPTHAYLNIGKSSPDPGRFMVAIPGRIRNEFANRDPENYYLGKNICVTGLIKKSPQESLPVIVVENPTQIEVSPTTTSLPAASTAPTPTATPTPEGFTYSLEKIPGSLNHSAESGRAVGTWWGYNQSKVARYEDTVFTYVVHNDNDPGTKTPMTLYKKVGEGPWEKGASMPCSVPGNILIDSNGGLHALVHDPENVLVSSSLGSLEHYYFPQAGNGDIDTFIHTTVVAGGDGNETVNKRVGASIGRDDTIALAFGLKTTEQFYYKKKSDSEWNHFIAGTNLGHNFYYPYPLVTESGYAILAIQDDNVKIDGKTFNPYHIAAYFQGNEHGWTHEFLLDNTQSVQALTHSEWQTVDISDIYLDTDNTIHLMLQDRVAYEWWHYRKAYGDSNWTITTIDTAWVGGVNWIRLIEIEGNLYYFMCSWSGAGLMNANGGNGVELDLEPPAGERQVKGFYPYIASPRTGTSAASEFVDILLLNGSSSASPNGPNYYLKIAKDYILQELK